MAFSYDAREAIRVAGLRRDRRYGSYEEACPFAFASFTPNSGPFMEFKGNADLLVTCATSSLCGENRVIRCPSGVGFGVTLDSTFVNTAVRVRTE